MTESRRWLVTASIVGLLILLYLLEPILIPFVAGLFLAYLLDPLVDRINLFMKGRTLATSIVMVIFFLVTGLLLLILIPILERQVIALIQSVPGFIDWIVTTAIPWVEETFDVEIITSESNQIREYLMSNWSQTGTWLKKALSMLTASSMTVAAWAMNIVLIPLVMFYFLRDWNQLVGQIKLYLPNRYRDTLLELLGKCDEVLSAFIRGQLIVMLSLGAIYSITLTIAGIRMGVLIGMLAGLFSIVPYLGFVVGIAAGLIAAFVQYGTMFALVKVAIAFGIGQLAESFFLTPILIGDKIGLHPVAVIFAILAGSQLFGFVGTLLALPVAAVLVVFLRHGSGVYLESKFYLRKR